MRKGFFRLPYTIAAGNSAVLYTEPRLPARFLLCGFPGLHAIGYGMKSPSVPPVLQQDQRGIRWIVVHHSASDRGATVSEIERWHRQRGWDDIGYHWLVDADGIIWQGRAEHLIGAHARGVNNESIGICCIGNFELEEPSAAILDSLIRLSAGIAARYHLDETCIIPHREVGNVSAENTQTLCPGKFLLPRLEEIRSAVRALLPHPVAEAGR
jgi:hypothetical protein